MLPTLLTPTEVLPCNESILASLIHEMNRQLVRSAGKVKDFDMLTLRLDLAKCPEQVDATGQCVATITKAERLALESRLTQAGWAGMVKPNRYPHLIEVLLITDHTEY